ncbi:MAG: ATP-binding protein, partial [Bacteroidota bacterium]
SLESFSYTVSHDLRGPIRNMIGLSTLLQRRKKDDEDLQEITSTIVHNAYKMNQLVEDILGFAKASNSPLNFRQLDMTQIFAEAYEELREEEDNREIHFELDPLKVAEGDPALIRQVVINLLSNALKYTRQQPETHISVKGMEQEDGDYLYLVKDNGAGFDEARKAELFQPFRRLHEESEFEGNGVGLAFSQKIVERHQGKLWAESAPNQGATFYFTLPMQTSQN